MRRILGAVVPVSIALVCLLVAAPVRADQVTVRDQRHDVSETRVGDVGAYVYQGKIREGDFIATTFRHGRDAVVVTSRFRDLAWVGNHHGYFLRLESARHAYRDVTLEAGPGLWRGRHVVTNRRGDRVRCGVEHAINYRRNIVRMIVPRSCFGDPRVVRGTAAAMWTRPDLDDPSQSDILDVDNPHNDDPAVDTWTRWIRRG